MKHHSAQAFLIGVKDYQHVQPLRTPLNDIRDLGQVLSAKYDYTVHTSENPTLEGLNLFMQRILSEVQSTRNSEDSFVLLYFAGHGIAQDSEKGIRGYLIPADGRAEDKTTWLSMEDLLSVVEELPNRHTLVMLDCCFSGSLRWASKHRTLGRFAEQENLYRQHYHYFMARTSCQVITSAAPDQLALDFLRRGTETNRSPFAECIIRGLQGEADTVPDKVITCAELFTYLQNQLVAVSSQYENPQNASLFPLDKHDFGEYLFFMDGFDPDNLALREYHNPYRGLSAYEPNDQGDFFGRSQAIEALLIEVKNNQLTVVLGASGSGKSSLVKAGIVPRLPGGRVGKIPVIKPGLTPLAELPDPATFDILVIDQLEQLVTQAEEKDAIIFLQRVGDMLGSGKKIIATLRIDYESRLPKTPELDNYWHRYYVPLFSAEELREVIVTPTFRQGRFIVPMSLVDRVIEEVIHYPGSLPLLSFTMRQLFERCKDTPYRNITDKDYEALGGVIGALQKKADAVYEALPDEMHRITMRHLMLRMVSLTGGETAGKRVLKSELIFNHQEENKRIAKVVGVLEEERLVHAGKDSEGSEFYEPSHDALIQIWKQMQEWVKDFTADNILLHARLQAALAEYSAKGNRWNHLWHFNPNRQLLLKKPKTDGIPVTLNEAENQFIRKSRQLSTRIWTGLAALVLSVIVGLSGLTLWARDEQNTAEQNAITAKKNEVLANTQTEFAKQKEREATEQAKIAERETKNAKNELETRIAAEKREKTERLNKLIAEGGAYRKEKKFDEALKAYFEGIEIGVANSTQMLNALIDSTNEEKNNHEFDFNLRTGLALKEANQITTALRYLQKARESKPNHKEVEEAIRQCNAILTTKQ